MNTLDRVSGWTLLVLGCLHTAGSIVQMSRNLNLESAWFFAGGLAVIFGAFLNLIRAYRPADRLVTSTIVLANLLLFILSLLLCWLLRHDLKQNPQAVVLVALVFVQLLFSIRSLRR